MIIEAATLNYRGKSKYSNSTFILESSNYEYQLNLLELDLCSIFQ